jgi:hypothetical protein
MRIDLDTDNTADSPSGVSFNSSNASSTLSPPRGPRRDFAYAIEDLALPSSPGGVMSTSDLSTAFGHVHTDLARSSSFDSSSSNGTMDSYDHFFHSSSDTFVTDNTDTFASSLSKRLDDWVSQDSDVSPSSQTSDASTSRSLSDLLNESQVDYEYLSTLVDDCTPDNDAHILVLKRSLSSFDDSTDGPPAKKLKHTLPSAAVSSAFNQVPRMTLKHRRSEDVPDPRPLLLRTPASIRKARSLTSEHSFNELLKKVSLDHPISIHH